MMILFNLATDCSIATPAANCWMLPGACPSILIGGTWRPYGAGNTCLDTCRAIKSTLVYYHDNPCPQ
jgi:hypothetical protein